MHEHNSFCTEITTTLITVIHHLTLIFIVLNIGKKRFEILCVLLGYGCRGLACPRSMYRHLWVTPDVRQRDGNKEMDVILHFSLLP